MATVLQTVMLDIRRGSQGRPKAPWRSMADKAAFVYLVRISKQYDIDTFKFLKHVHGAWIRGEASCDGLSIKRRQMAKDVATLLITRNQSVIAQVRLTSTMLNYLGKPEVLNLRFEGYTPPKSIASQAEHLEIKELNSETKRFNLDAKVTAKSSPRTVMSRWGETFLLSTATIMDDSGTIKLPLWKDQIDMISVGDWIHLENARLERFRGEFQVRVDRLARLSVIRNQQNEKQFTTKT